MPRASAGAVASRTVADHRTELRRTSSGHSTGCSSRASAGTTARPPRAPGDRRCPRRETPLGASACACRPDRTCTRARPVPRRRGCCPTARARPSTTRSRPNLRTARRAASEVTFTIVPCDARSRGSAILRERERREHVHLVHRCAARRAGTSASAGCGDGPRTLALFTSRSRPPSASAAATSASRCRAIGDVAGDRHALGELRRVRWRRARAPERRGRRGRVTTRRGPGSVRARARSPGRRR